MENKDVIISFDFDATLSLPSTQEVAKDLIQKGFSVIVTTTRHNKYLNQDLIKITERLNINKIVYTNGDGKEFFMEGVDIHIDNDETELRNISRGTFTETINVTEKEWKTNLYNLLP